MIYKHQNVYESRLDSSGKVTLLKDSLTTSCIAKIIRRDSVIAFNILEGNFKSDTLKTIVKKPNYKGLFFPYMDSITNNEEMFIASKKLRYHESSPVIQAITIPLKIRFAQGSEPYTASGSINAGFALGWKFTHNVYKNYYHRKTGLFLNNKTNGFSVTPGIFLGPSVLELTTKTTTLTADRDVLGFTYGGMLVFGINKLSIGVASGLDYTIGDKTNSWIYQGKPWLGLTIAFNFLD